MKEQEDQNIIDSPELVQEKSIAREMIIWWERKRLIYNLIIVGLSVYLMYDFWDYPWRKIVGGDKIILNAILFILKANIIYTCTWGFGVVFHYLNNYKGLQNSGRWVLFGLGTVFSIIVTDIYFILAFDVLFAD